MRSLPVLVLVLALFIPILAQAQQGEEELLAEADELFKEGQYTQARLIYRQHRLEFPASPRSDYAAFRLAKATSLDRSLKRNQRYAEAIRLYELAITEFEDSPLAPLALYDLAVTYLNLGFVQDAIIQLRRAREEYPQAPNQQDILLLLADSYYFLDDFRQSSILYRSFLNEYPDSSNRMEVLAKLAESYQEIADYGSANRTFETLVEQYPDYLPENPQLRFLYAENLFHLGRYQEARDIYTDLRGLEDAEYLKDFVRYGLARIAEQEAVEQEDPEERRRLLRTALDLYESIYQANAETSLELAALLEMVRLGDELDLNISQIYELPPVDELLLNLYNRQADPENKALVLVRLAQHHRRNERYITALDYYNQMIELYGDGELAGQTITEYNRFLRSVMEQARRAGDYDQFLNLYLRYGLNMELEQEEQFDIAIAYMRVGLYEEAEQMFEALLAYGLDEARTRRIAVERMRYYFQRRLWEETERQIARVLAMEPLPEERELALLYEQEIAFARRNLDLLQTMYFDEKDKIDTPLLHISMLQKLARLHFLSNNIGLAREYIEEIFNDYQPNQLDEDLVFPILKAAWLIRADVYYTQGEHATAANAYEHYLFYAQPEDSLAWALSQLAESYLKLGREELARDVLEAFIDRYPDHYLAARVQIRLDELSNEQS